MNEVPGGDISFSFIRTSPYGLNSISVQNNYGAKWPLFDKVRETAVSSKSNNARPEYHPACKDETSTLKLIELTADVFETLKKIQFQHASVILRTSVGARRTPTHGILLKLSPRTVWGSQ